MTKINKKELSIILAVVLGIAIILATILIIIYVRRSNNSRSIRSSQRSSDPSFSVLSSSIPIPILPCYEAGTIGNIFAVTGQTDNPGFDGNNQPANTGIINNPEGMVFDFNQCILYFCDRGNKRVRAIDYSVLQPTIRTIIGTGAQNCAFTSPSIPLSPLLSEPTGIFLENDGTLLICDPGFNRILRYNNIDNNNIEVELWAGSSLNCNSGFSGTNRSDAVWNQPTSITKDLANNYYVADSGNNVIRIITAQNNVFTFAGGGSNIPTGNPINPLLVAFTNPTDILFVENRLYFRATITIQQSSQNVILTISSLDSSPLLSVFYTNPNLPITSFTYNSAQTKFWITSAPQSCVYSIFLLGDPFVIEGGNPGVPGNTGNDNPAVNALISNPGRCCVDNSGVFYFSCTNPTAVIRRIRNT